MIRLFASDLDGTAIVGDRIDEKNARAFQKLEERGTVLAFVTGRVASSAQYLAEDAGVHPYIVGNNGGVLISPQGEVLEEYALTVDQLRELIDYCHEHKFYFHLYDRETFYSEYLWIDRLEHLERDYDLWPKYQVNIHIRPDLYPYLVEKEIPVLKLQITLPLEEQAQVLEDFKDREDLYVTRSGNYFIEFMNPAVNKWHSIQSIADRYGFSREEISAIGDFENDREMIQNAGTGIAMGQALDCVKEVSDYVTADCEDHGLAQAVDYLLAKEKEED